MNTYNKASYYTLISILLHLTLNAFLFFVFVQRFLEVGGIFWALTSVAVVWLGYRTFLAEFGDWKIFRLREKSDETTTESA